MYEIYMIIFHMLWYANCSSILSYSICIFKHVHESKTIQSNTYIDELRFKGHDMLAPFTSGSQSSDVHPLLIEKSEVDFCLPNCVV